MHSLYSVPVIVPPVQLDSLQYWVPGDLRTVIAVPLAKDRGVEAREYNTRTYCPLPESGLKEFGQWICSEGWGILGVCVAVPFFNLVSKGQKIPTGFKQFSQIGVLEGFYYEYF